MSAAAANLVHVVKSLMRYWGLTLLTLLGLATGFAAAVIIGLYVRDELEFDRFFPGADKVLMLTSVYSPPGSPLVSNDKTPEGVAGWLRSDSPAVDAVGRLYPAEWSLRSSRVGFLAYFYWADANIFDLLPLKAVSGDLKTALSQPYSLVLTQRMARRYFGRENVVGETMFFAGSSPVTVTAVLADFPANTSLNREIFVSGSSGYSMFSVHNLHPDWQWASSYTFVRLKPDAHLAPPTVRAIAARHWLGTFNFPVKFNLVPLRAMHFQPEGDSPMAPRGHMDTVVGMIAVAGVILFLAAVNFAGLMTAQIDERRNEMAIRRGLGARRHHLFLHVMTEAAVITVLATLAGLALAERLLPIVNPLLGLNLSLWSAPLLAGCFAVAAVLTGLVGGLYPAIVLSANPAGRTRKSSRSSGHRPHSARVGWIAVQFTLLIMLLVSSQIVYRQWLFATGPALNFDASNLLQITVYDGTSQTSDFKAHILAVDGVAGGAFSRFMPEVKDIRPAWTTLPSGRIVQFDRQSVDTDFFRLFGVQLLAGRNFSAGYSANHPPAEIILNLSAARALGYTRPGDAVGQTLDYVGDHAPIRSRIIGVVSDMRISSVREPLQPMLFDSQSTFFTRLNVRLEPGHEASTVAAIEQAWKKDFPGPNAIDWHFYAGYLGDLYHDMNQQWCAFGLLSLVGVCLSVLGLTSLSIYLARTRQREIAIRNALGARWWDMALMRAEPLVRPLLVANVIASLASWALMSWWLDTFAAHIDLDLVPFVASCAVAVLVALTILIVHALMSAPARSSQPLRV